MFGIKQRHSSGWRFLLGCVFGLAIALLLLHPIHSLGTDLETQLPTPQTHPLPNALAQWSAGGQNYFAEIQPSPVGYLIWSNFPVQAYIAPIVTGGSPSAQRRQQQWQESVQEAIAAWSAYLPLSLVEQAETADIVIERRAPPPEIYLDLHTGERRFSFAKNAETTYQFYLDSEGYLRHRMTIQLSPHQGAIATRNTAQHELGHALGIWGHSTNPTDALFYSQNGGASIITDADINTLKKIYQQPTRLGWKMPR